ncbi:type IV secretory system conjugative DNA transfer family protein [Paraburkholderia sp. BCC1885]|uniref:type IV secretory system conjugative DNA transfer family protein n=1 Tax=Paraburkholderia sp. BCC1885 TaxID=2562669 RepID=UPI0021B1DFAF|nr:type IV secretory system conjugative DNA transfer family protein [Paraburkholderia sp. BCC1885]
MPAIVVGLWRGRYLRFTGQQFVLLAAPARSGKGVGIVVPNLLSYPDSAVVLDIKQENFRITAGFRAAHGQQVFLFNPFAEDFRTHRYNPLSAISDGVFRVGDILAIGYALYPAGGHDDFWKDQARNLFLGLVLLLCELRDVRDSARARQPAGREETTPDVPDYPVTMGEVLRQSSGNGVPLRRYLQMTLRRFNEHLSGACVDALNRFLSNDDKVLASILATFNAPLTIWANPIVDAATSANDFDLRQVRMQRMTVYIGITPDHLPEAALLVNLLFSQLVNLNTKQLPQDNAGLRYQCLLLMDEFTAIGKVDIIAKAVSYMAGYNLRLLPIIQSVSQLESVYGRADARTFVTNHAMQILYAPREQKDANEYSEMLGTFTEKSRSVSRPSGWSGGRGGSESISDQRRALLLPQELKEIGQTKEIILLENTRPILAEKICYWKDPVFIERLRPAPAIPVLDVALFRARLERRLRVLTVDDMDSANRRLTGTTVNYLEVLAAWDERDLPVDMVDISEGEASEYVSRHLAFIGVPQPALAEANRALSLAELEGGELQAEPILAPAAAAAVVQGLFSQVGGGGADAGGSATPAGEQEKTSRKRGPRKAAGAASAKQLAQQPGQPKRTKGKRAAGTGDKGARP